MRKIVLLSGPVGAGKSTLARRLECEYANYRIRHVRTHQILRQIEPNVENTRDALQLLGERLDRRTKGAWVRDALREMFHDQDGFDHDILIVDAVRIPGQIEAIQDSYGRRVVHIHLTAPSRVLAERYRARPKGDFRELSSYRRVQENPTEARVGQLADIADVVIDSKRCTSTDVLVRAACHIGIYGREWQRLVDVLVGGQYGSEGKGQIAAYLASDYDVLVRVGGPNAGHTVFRKPSPYTFHHLPSGTLSSNAQLVIGPGAVLRADDLMKEIAECEVEYDRLSIDPRAMTITDGDQAAEKKGVVKSISSTGRGVGEATARKIRGRGRTGDVVLARDIPDLRPYIRETARVLEESFSSGQRVLLEGTQGTGLSIHHGHYPFVTSRDTSVAGCLAEAGISPSRVRKVILVCRTYPIRVEGNSGPMSQEITWEEVAKRSKISLEELISSERTSTTDRQRRVGEFDWRLLWESVSLNAPTDIALTFIDYITIKNRKARRFDQLNDESIQFIEEIERVSRAPVSLISTRFHSRAIIDRRTW